jgi:hypothetical protein
MRRPLGAVPRVRAGVLVDAVRTLLALIGGGVRQDVAEDGADVVDGVDRAADRAARWWFGHRTIIPRR